MRAVNFVKSHPYGFFFILLSVGILVSLIYSNALSLNPGYVPPVFDQLTDRQKAVLSEEEELSKRLLGLASGALAAAIGIRLSDKPLADEPVMMTAYAALVVSLFGAFLSHETRLSILRIGPLDYLYSPLFLLPTRIQFWSFTLGISALGWSLFRSAPKTIAMIVLLVVPSCLHAQQKPAFDPKGCIVHWYWDRFGVANSDHGKTPWRALACNVGVAWKFADMSERTVTDSRLSDLYRSSPNCIDRGFCVEVKQVTHIPARLRISPWVRLAPGPRVREPQRPVH